MAKPTAATMLRTGCRQPREKHLGTGFRLKIADSVLEWHASTSLEFHCILICNRRENMWLWSPTNRHCCP